MEQYKEEIQRFWDNCYDKNSFATESDNENMKKYLNENNNISQDIIDMMFLCCFAKMYDIEIINDLFYKYNANPHITTTVKYDMDERKHKTIDCIDVMMQPIFDINYDIQNEPYLDLYMSYLYKNNTPDNINFIKNKFTLNKLDEFVSAFGFDLFGDLLKFCKKNNIELFHKKTILDYSDVNINSFICNIITSEHCDILFIIIKYTKHYITINSDFMEYRDYSYMLHDLWHSEGRDDDSDYEAQHFPFENELYEMLYYLASLGLMYKEGKRLRKIDI